MHFIFWQKNLSIHQAAFLRDLAKEAKVSLVVAEEYNPARKAQGWHRPDYGFCEIMVGPSDLEILDLVRKDPQAVHIFSGFFAVPMIALAYREVFALGYQALFFLEPFDKKGLKGVLRWLKYTWFIQKHQFKIKALLVTGEKAKALYQSCGMPEKKVFSWGYFTEKYERDGLQVNKSEANALPEICYVGQLIPRKNIFHLVEALKGLQGLFHQVTFIGRGELEQKLAALSKQYDWLELKSFVPNTELVRELIAKDILILPSTFDGWGAVVNEALQAGTSVIASQNCGAGSLLDGEVRGEVFSFSGDNTLEAVLRKWLAKGKVSAEQRQAIQEWSERNISGEAAAVYFVQIVEYLDGKMEVRPEAPWVRHRRM